jgi:hypothetical protein
MRRNANRQSEPVANGTGEAVTQYLAALEEVYPPAKGATRVVVRPDRHVIVSAPLPSRSRDRMRLFDQMADVATRLLLETDQYIILSSQ